MERRKTGQKNARKKKEQINIQNKNHAGIRPKAQCLWFIYQIPSTFFRELVDCDRGFRMILMV